jgi:hypothetical protein
MRLEYLSSLNIALILQRFLRILLSIISDFYKTQKRQCIFKDIISLDPDMAYCEKAWNFPKIILC